jgi:hypothetical protein
LRIDNTTTWTISSWYVAEVEHHEEYTFDIAAVRWGDSADETVSLDELAEAWCRHCAWHGDPEIAESEDQWASDYLFDPDVFEDGDRYRALILRLVHFANEDVLGNVAAGPLECLGLDDETIDWLVAHCETNEKLRKAMGGSYYPDYLTEEQLCRLEAAARITIWRPTPPVETPPELLTAAAQCEGGDDMVNSDIWPHDDDVAGSDPTRAGLDHMWAADGSQSV